MLYVYSIHCIPRFFFQFQSYVLVQINESNNVLVFWPASPVPLFWLDNTIANSSFFKQSQALDLIFLCCLNRNINGSLPPSYQNCPLLEGYIFRFFKLFPLINMHDGGLQRFAKYMNSKVAATSQQNITGMCPFQNF